MRRAASAALLFFSVTAAADPREAIARGKYLLRSGDCRLAIKVLQGAIPDAVALRRHDRDAALADIHFHTAIAFSDCGLPDNARAALREYLRFEPDEARDISRLSNDFVALLEETRQIVSALPTDAFERFYPGYNEFARFQEPPGRLASWAASPAFQLFGTPEEKNRWPRLTNDIERSAFVQKFWEHRDRRLLQNRIAFADNTFLEEDETPGSLTDRGRVFVLLGPPARVTHTVIGGRETGAWTERWVYDRSQLRAAIPALEVEFRFVTQSGYGEGVMEKDFMALKALAEAKKSFDGRPRPE
jgi:GWxTD domain-containing protein